MNTMELTTLRNFVDELRIDDMFDHSIASDESSVASFTSEDTNELSSSDDDMAKVVAKARHRKVKQKIYDKKWKEGRKIRVAAATRTFVAGLKLLNGLLEDRIQRTIHLVVTLRLVHASKDDQKVLTFVNELQTVEHESKRQFTLDHEAVKYVNLWSVTWTQTKVEKGKFFLRQTVPEINSEIDKMVQLGQKLSETMNELEWCMSQKPMEVWL